MGLKRCAYVTLATNDIYAKSALVLARTLRNSGTSFPVILLISHDSTISAPLQGLLQEAFDRVISVSSIVADNKASYVRSDLAVTLTKLHVFDLDNLDLVCYLDAETMVQANVDHLFETESAFSAAPDFGWPDTFNSGVFITKPSKQVYKDLVNVAGQPDPSYDGGDQGLLNTYFKNWTRLSVLYNLPVDQIGRSVNDAAYARVSAFQKFGQDTKIIHFIGVGANKPWSSDATNETVGYFKNMWNQLLREEMAKLINMPPPSMPSHSMSQPTSRSRSEDTKMEPSAFASQAPARNESKPTASFEEIWSHLSSQFKK